MSKRKRLWSGGGVLVGLICGFSAGAQEVEPSSTPVTAEAPQAASTSDEPVAIDEVVVTARKREERLRDVPMAASAITEALKEALALDNMDDYLRQVPSTTLVTSGPEYLNDVSIRGQGSGRLGFSETATGMFRDGMYTAGGGFGGRSLSRMDLFDIDRIEVMRGPQGALFGRNSVGGAINVVSKRPDAEFGGKATARVSSFERRDFEAVVNAPLTEDLGLRVGGLFNEQKDGYIVNETTGNKIDRQRYLGFRSALDYAASEQLKLGATYEYYDAEAPAFSSLGQRPTRVDGTALDPSRDRRADMNREGVSDISQHSGLLTADYDLSWANLALKVNRGERDGQRTNEDNDHFGGQSSIDVTPGDAVTGPDYTLPQFENFTRTSFQTYLASTGDSAWSWLGGLEGLWTKSDAMVDPDCPTYTGALQTDASGCYPGRVGTLPTASASVRSSVRLGLNHDDFDEQLKSYSLFGSVDWKMTAALKLGVEMRVQRDEKNFDFVRYSEDPLVYFGTGTPPTGLSAPISVDPDGTAGPATVSPVQFCPPTLSSSQCAAGLETARLSSDRNWTFWTPAATLHYTFTPRQAAYLRYATGYRPGGFNTQEPPTTVRTDLEPGLLYDPEKAFSYEVGWKGRIFGIFDGDAAIFYSDTHDVQVVSAPSALSRGFVLQNAGDAYVYGAELELRNTVRLGPGRLISSLAVSSQNGEFKDGATALVDVDSDGIPDQADLSGKEVPRLRDYQIALNLAYTAPLSSSLTGLIGLSYQTADGGYETPNNTSKYEGYNLLDGRIGVQGEHWKLSVFGRNLTDERYVLNVVGADYFWNDPRTVGVELTMTY